MEWAREMTCRLNRAVNGEKDRIIAEYRDLTGKSAATLYRIARKHGFSSGRKKRCDNGSCRLDEHQIQYVSSLVQVSAREVKGTILPVTEALSIAEDNGIIEPGRISAARMQSILRERDMNAAALNSITPSIRMASLHPNHVHIFDASPCIQYYMKKGKDLGFMDQRDFREKKPKNYKAIKNRIWRMVLADHFSHHLFVKYYIADGENARMTFDFLTSAWRGGHHEKSPFRGVPFYLLMDAGSANTAKGIMALLKRLEIEMPENMPHNPRRQGSAENAQNIVETRFEARLRFEPATTIEELNEWVTDWLVEWNDKKIHSRHRMTRTACWLTIKEDQIRDLPSDEILQDLYAEPEVTRTVRQDNTITFRSEEYRLKHIEGIRPGRKVQVVLRPYHWPEVTVVFNDTEYLVSPIGELPGIGRFRADSAIIGQEYKSNPDTLVDKTRKANENLAYGDERKKDDLPFGGTLQVFGHQSDKVDAVPMRRRGTPMEVGRDVAIKQIPIVELFKKLRDAGVRVTPQINTELRKTFGGSVPAARADEIVMAMADGNDWRDAGPVAEAM